MDIRPHGLGVRIVHKGAPFTGPLDYLTRLVVRHRVTAPASTIKFERFSNRWTVTLGRMFRVALDPGRYIGNVWHICIPEGLREVLWKEMNGAQVLGARYFGTANRKSDMGRVCPSLWLQTPGPRPGHQAHQARALVDIVSDTR